MRPPWRPWQRPSRSRGAAEPQIRHSDFCRVVDCGGHAKSSFRGMRVLTFFGQTWPGLLPPGCLHSPWDVMITGAELSEEGVLSESEPRVHLSLHCLHGLAGFSPRLTWKCQWRVCLEPSAVQAGVLALGYSSSLSAQGWLPSAGENVTLQVSKTHRPTSSRDGTWRELKASLFAGTLPYKTTLLEQLLNLVAPGEKCKVLNFEIRVF